ncbi:uncharacterized protein CDAR_546231 [Caerostris darwini]|uniref:Uncharacterized protein n=1 Tax=Caerostris darwini TaxID=1538125 RepID=A0AAV4RKP3_9ARAC|nr:uncharacterized protein CDAR_546231 [Caerostris darwini]
MNNKFIIGLGATVPSTRILKPPGGDCSDLFGLKSRQQALMKNLKKSTGDLDCLLNSLSVGSSDQNFDQFIAKNSSMSSEKDFDAKSQLTEDLDTLSTKDFTESPTSSSHINSNETLGEKRISQQNLTQIKTSNDESKINYRAKSGHHNIKKRESTSSQGKTDPKAYSDKYKRDNSAQNKKVAVKETLQTEFPLRKNQSKMNIVTESKTEITEMPEKKFIRNPITGDLTERKSWNKSSSIMSSISTKPIPSNDNSNNSSVKHELKTSSKEYIPRNPITGEGVPNNPYSTGIFHHRIRVIHPPGGESSGFVIN